MAKSKQATEGLLDHTITVRLSAQDMMRIALKAGEDHRPIGQWARMVMLKEAGPVDDEQLAKSAINVAKKFSVKRRAGK